MYKISTFKEAISLLKIFVMLFLVLITYTSCNNNTSKNDWRTENLKGKVKSYTELSYEILEEKKQENHYKKEVKNFDQDGKIINELLYNFDGVGNQFIPKYNEKNEKTAMYCYVENSDKLIYRWIYSYNEKGLKIKDEIYDASDKLTLERFFKYDEKGNKIERTQKYVYNPDTALNKRTFEYDESGRNIRINTYDPFGKNIKSHYDFVYDDGGNKIEENILNPNGKLTSKWIYKYEFDEKGNWIKKTEFDQGIFPKNIIERTYEYYN
ncbi:hypothetical protein [uncultured Tenacibaculum sp.]|uniref:hypothetical protein n=1 Tax=uncultured Tenacibaculum sp. TaxID=174713 RepID=UPI00262C0D42|nr:hypothetical protein [uncultured Tenacibaculum sp.]